MKPISVELYNPKIITEYIDNGKVSSIKQNICPVIEGKEVTRLINAKW